MSYQEDDYVGFFVCLFVVGEFEYFVLTNIRLHHENICIVTALHDFGRDILGW